jgi:hypothetical protein
VQTQDDLCAVTDAAIEAQLQHAPKFPRGELDGPHLSPSAAPATVIAGMWPDSAENETNAAWVRNYYQVTAPHFEDGGYLTFMSDDDQDRIQANCSRLVYIKRKFDSDNLFRVRLRAEFVELAQESGRTGFGSCALVSAWPTEIGGSPTGEAPGWPPR